MSDKRKSLKVDQDVGVPSNPELVHVEETSVKTRAAQDGNFLSTVHHQQDPRLGLPSVDGTVYVTEGVPNMVVQVNPGQNVVVPDSHEVGIPGSYWGAGHENEDGSIQEAGDEFATHGPTAHMLEARGVVTIQGVAA